MCPWNSPKFVQLTAEGDYRARAGAGARPGVPGTDGPRLVELLGMGEEEWDEFSRASAIRRAGRAGFLRNVAVALGNWRSAEAVPALVGALSDPEPLVRGHAAWALGRVGSTDARRATEDRLEVELDPFVREELASALGS